MAAYHPEQLCSVKQGKNERGYYHSFVQMCNHALCLMQNTPFPGISNAQHEDFTILFHVSDPSELKGEYGPHVTARKPDVVLMTHGCAFRMHEDEISANSAEIALENVLEQKRISEVSKKASGEKGKKAGGKKGKSKKGKSKKGKKESDTTPQELPIEWGGVVGCIEFKADDIPPVPDQYTIESSSKQAPLSDFPRQSGATDAGSVPVASGICSSVIWDATVLMARLF